MILVKNILYFLMAILWVSNFVKMFATFPEPFAWFRMVGVVFFPLGILLGFF